MFPSGFAFENATNITFSGCIAGPCPVCRGQGDVLDGTFDFIGDTIRLLQGPSATVDRLHRLAAILREAQQRDASADEIRRKVEDDLPELSRISDLLPRTRQELYAFITLLLAVIALMIQTGKKNGDINISIDQVINNCVVQGERASPVGSSQPQQALVPVKSRAVAGRNDPCPCGSGRKYKHCHGRGT